MKIGLIHLYNKVIEILTRRSEQSSPNFAPSLRSLRLRALHFYGRIIAILLLIAATLPTKASDIKVSPTAKFSILTCTPGPDLYSLFGHSAIRFQDTVRGQLIDWVYNYGTFQFDEDFYVKFARGKLDYLLSKEDFPYFQLDYIYEGRGIAEQELLLTQEDKQKLLDLLEENYLPQNRTYRYDFFYDNCTTRIRDIIQKATDGKVEFNYVYSKPYTFRQAIQTYLDYQPWSDFGIDIALGIPCDNEIQKGEFMFLPDSLMNEFDHATLRGQPLILSSEELLPADYKPEANSIFTPVVVFFVFFVLHLIIGFLFIRRKRMFQITDRLLLFVTGLVGLLVVFLWFFTDHTATVWNLNILWANPVNLILAFASTKNWSGWKKKYITVYFFILTLTLLTWFILPQRMHLAVISIIVALIFTCLKVLRPQIFLGLNKR